MRELRRFGLLLALASDHGALCLLLLICHPEREANLGIAPVKFFFWAPVKFFE